MEIPNWSENQNLQMCNGGSQKSVIHISIININCDRVNINCNWIPIFGSEQPHNFKK